MKATKDFKRRAQTRICKLSVRGTRMCKCVYVFFLPVVTGLIVMDVINLQMGQVVPQTPSVWAVSSASSHFKFEQAFQACPLLSVTIKDFFSPSPLQPAID